MQEKILKKCKKTIRIPGIAQLRKTKKFKIVQSKNEKINERLRIK